MTSAEEDQDIKGCHTCPLRRGWTNWAVAAWRGHGFGMGLTASFNACRDITKKVKPDFSQGWTAGGWESRQELKLNKFRLDIRISFFPMKRVRHWKRLPKGVFGKSTSHRLVQLQVPQMVWNLMSYSGSASPSYQSPTSLLQFGWCGCSTFWWRQRQKKSVSTSSFSISQVTTSPVSFWRLASLSCKDLFTYRSFSVSLDVLGQI